MSKAGMSPAICQRDISDGQRQHSPMSHQKRHPTASGAGKRTWGGYPFQQTAFGISQPDQLQETPRTAYARSYKVCLRCRPHQSSLRFCAQHASSALPEMFEDFHPFGERRCSENRRPPLHQKVLSMTSDNPQVRRAETSTRAWRWSRK